jgi:phosphotriesterase-related protein
MSKVRTVTGDVMPSELGLTLMHEHLLVNNPWLMEPKNEEKAALAKAPITMNIRGELWRDANICADNQVLDSASDAISEILEYKKAGGQSLVDVTLIGLARDHKKIADISKAAGINIICGTGWYLDFTFPSYVRNATAESLSETIRKELIEGIDGTEIRAGVIGEIGCSYPWTNDERKVMEAAAVGQAKTGAPIDIHPGFVDPKNKRYVKPGHEYLDMLKKKDANFEKIYMSHMDYTADDVQYHRSIIDKYGIVLGYDDFGQEQYYDTLYAGCGGTSDKVRVKALVELLASGYEKHLVLSHDICLKMNLKKYGGFGYSHVLKHIVPELLDKGATQKQIDTMLIENPKRLLAWC